jgi:uncharacterized membrane protein
MNHPRSPIIKNTLLALPIRLLAILLITTVLVSFVPGGSPIANAQAPPTEIIGIVVNGTEGGVVPADLEVLLLTVDDAAGQIIEQDPTTVNADGTFSFGNLISSPGITFRVVANAGKFTPSVDLSSVDDWSNVRLTIYDETASLDDITLSSYVMMIPTIDARSRQAGILTVVNVNNTGDMVWIPDLEDPGLTGLDLLRFNLLDGFSDLSVESELPAGNILQIDTGFAMTNPIPPGEAAILMSYIIGYSGDGFDFTLKLPYGLDQVRLLLPDGGGTISGEGLGEIASVVVAENVFNSVEGNDYPAGSELVITFSGMPQPTLLQSVSDFFQGRTYVIVIIWIVGIALLGILGYAMYSSRKGGRSRDDTAEVFASRGDVVAEIAALDEAFESDEIEEGTYRDRRDDLKQQALDFEHTAASDSAETTEVPEDSEK